MNPKTSIRRITSNQRNTPDCDLASCRGATGLPPRNDGPQRVPSKTSDLQPAVRWRYLP